MIIFNQFPLISLRPWLGCRLIFGVGLLLIPTISEAQLKFRDAPNLQTPDFLTEEQADTLWANALHQQGMGSFEFLFNIEYRPYRKPLISFPGRMMGYWEVNQRITRFEVLDEAGNVLQNILLKVSAEGLETYQWKLNQDKVLALDAEQSFDDLIEGIPLNAFILGMPFWYWNERNYIGSARILGRPVHLFRVVNPIKNQTVDVVEIAIDEDFAAPLEAIFYNNKKNIIQEFKVRSIQKEDGHWIAKHWSFGDIVKKSSIHLNLVDVSFGVSFEPSFLAPSSLKDSIQVIRD